jgi:release factor glutamine methyltransferase
MPKLSQLLNEAASLGMARIDAQMLLLHACQRESHDRAWLMAHGDDWVSTAQLDAWQAASKRRMQGEPIAYIVGFKEFYGLRLMVNPSVLDPRDDTETLVDWALELIAHDQPLQALDLGTGSGAVALALRSKRPLLHVCATDASNSALAVAQMNSHALALPIRFIQADASQPDWFSCVCPEIFDIIVSNPPYIAEGDAHLAALKHEPEMALISGSSGLDAIRAIIKCAPQHLRSGGWLVLEHGYDQAAAVRDLFAVHSFDNIATRQDLGGVDRCTGAQFF